ncbi:MAG: RDD family protein [Burkholderiales bacterium]
MNSPLQYPTLVRRLMCMFYEALLLAAVLFIAGFLFIYATNYPQHPALRPVLQIFLLLIVASYFVWFWCKGGQTLAMKTWRLRIETEAGQLLSVPQALQRFARALLGFLFGGITIWWALFDYEKQFLHDRLAGSRVVLVKNKK